MHSTHLLLEEPIRMASILEPSKTVTPQPFTFLMFHRLKFFLYSLFVLFFLVVMCWVEFLAEFLSFNDEDCGHSGSEIKTSGSYFWLSQGWNVWYKPFFFSSFLCFILRKWRKIGRTQHWAFFYLYYYYYYYYCCHHGYCFFFVSCFFILMGLNFCRRLCSILEFDKLS